MQRQRQDAQAGRRVHRRRDDATRPRRPRSPTTPPTPASLRTYSPSRRRPATIDAAGRCSRSRRPTASSPARARSRARSRSAYPNYFSDDEHGRGRDRRPDATVAAAGGHGLPAGAEPPRPRQLELRNLHDATFDATGMRVYVAPADGRRRRPARSTSSAAELDVKNWPSSGWGTAPGSLGPQLGRPEQHRLRPGPAVRHLQDLPQGRIERWSTAVRTHAALRQHQDRAGATTSIPPTDTDRRRGRHQAGGGLLMRRLRSEDGFTLPELLITMAIAMIVSLATFTLIEIVMKRSGEVGARVETTATARTAMDQITRQLRSQVCAKRSDGRPTARSIDAAVADVAHRLHRLHATRHVGPARCRRRTCARSRWASNVFTETVIKGTRDTRQQRHVSYRAPTRRHVAPVPGERRRRPSTPATTRPSRSSSATTSSPTRPAELGQRRRGSTRASRSPPNAYRALTDAELGSGGPHQRRLQGAAQQRQRERRHRARERHLRPHRRPQRTDPEAHMPDVLKRLDARAERGFSMFLVIMAMFVTVAVRRRRVRRRQRRPAGRRHRDGAQVRLRGGRGRAELLPEPPAAGPGLLDQVRHGLAAERPRSRTRSTRSNARPDPRAGARSRTPTDQYTIELLPTAETPAERQVRPERTSRRFVDQEHGHVPGPRHGPHGHADGRARARSSPRSGATASSTSSTSPTTRTATRRPSPTATERARQATNCANKYRSARASATAPRSSSRPATPSTARCTPTTRACCVCGTPTFGRTQNMDGSRPRQDRRHRGAWSGTGLRGQVRRRQADDQHADARNRSRPKREDAEPAGVQQAARGRRQTPARASTRALTWIRLNGDTMQITTTARRPPRRGRRTACCTCRTTSRATARPRPRPTTPTSRSPAATSTSAAPYSQSLTIAAENDVIIMPTGGATSAGHHRGRRHRRDARPDREQLRPRRAPRGRPTAASNTAPVQSNVTIDAAILALQHSFIVDNYQCGNAMAKLTVTRRDRAEVPRSGRHRLQRGRIASGYAKNYWYDDRFRYRSPPYFLTPVAAAWDVVRSHEVVKGS